MKTNKALSGSYIESSFIEKGEIGDINDFLAWYAGRNAAGKFNVNQIPFSKSEQWFHDENCGYLKHYTGKFFSIEGIRVRTNFGQVTTWEQIIINQPEIGILGIISK